MDISIRARTQVRYNNTFASNKCKPDMHYCQVSRTLLEKVLSRVLLVPQFAFVVEKLIVQQVCEKLHDRHFQTVLRFSLVQSVMSEEVPFTVIENHARVIVHHVGVTHRIVARDALSWSAWTQHMAVFACMKNSRRCCLHRGCSHNGCIRRTHAARDSNFPSSDRSLHIATHWGTRSTLRICLLYMANFVQQLRPC